MFDKHWTTGNLQKLFKLEDKSRYAIFSAEEKGLIPTATRINRGNTKVRSWSVSQLPKIGEKFGFIKKPDKQIVICTYVPKGGVLKTALSYNIARILALNGIKVLVIGLDIVQSSMTGYALPQPNIQSLEEWNPEEDLGLYHLLCENMPLSKIIKKTNLPTLDVIAETSELNLLEKKLRDLVKREFFFQKKLIPNLADYDVIIFDNGPSWNLLVENSLSASSTIISPLGCDIEAFKAVSNHLSIIFEFKDAVGINWNHFIQVPTLLETNKLSQQIYGAYLNKYGEYVISTPVRRSIVGQEARAYHQSVIEYDPSSSLSDDYYKIIEEIWKKISKE